MYSGTIKERSEVVRFLDDLEAGRISQEEILEITELSLADINEQFYPTGLIELKNLQSLDLSNNHLESLPEWIRELRNLQSLDLKGNQIESLPEWVRELKNLQSLNLNRNRLTNLPEWMSELKNLQSLNLSVTNIESLPEWMKGLTNLQNLNLAGNSLSSLPKWMRDLQKLKNLYLNFTHLSSLPEWIGELRNLQSLYLAGNFMFSLPVQMKKLRNLQTLDLNWNRLSSLPEWMRELSNLKSLDLSRNSIESLPEWMSELKNLQSLNLGENCLESLPEWISELKNLQRLNLGENRLESLPEWMGELRNLQSLDLRGNDLESLPEWMSELTNLQSLNLRQNNLESLPEWMSELTNLQSLDLGQNNLESLPEWMKELMNLQSLDLRRNRLSSLPGGMRQLINLQRLYLGYNSLESLPEWIRELRNLQSLDLSANRLSSLPEWLMELKNLQSLNLSRLSLEELSKDLVFSWREKKFSFRNYLWNENGVINIEKLILANQPIDLFLSNDWNRITAYFENSESEKVELREAKVVFLGDGNAGKTHTIERLLRDGEGKDIVTTETPGVKIEKWFPDKDDFTVNLWDFGGQQIMHSMHRCFLTQRCLYVVVLRERSDSPFSNLAQQARYWLSNIQSFAPDSKVLLAINWEKETTIGAASINMDDLKRDFPNNLIADPVSFCAVEKDADRFKEFMEILLRHVRALESVTYPFWKHWNEIRKVLDSLSTRAGGKKPYITAEEYSQLCDKYAEKNDLNKTTLLSWLNALGVCFSYHELDTDYRILDPEWLTNAIYAIITTRQINGNASDGEVNFHKYGNGHGGISHKEILELLNDSKIRKTSTKHEKYTKGEVKYILEVMRKFQLSYPLSGMEFIPALCPQTSNSVLYPEHYKNSLEYEIHYGFLPDSVIHRLMVICQKKLNMKNCFFQSFSIDEDIIGVKAVVDMRSTINRLYISIYDIQGDNQMYKILKYLREQIAEVNKQLNLKPKKEYVVGRQNGYTALLDMNKMKLLLDRGKHEIDAVARENEDQLLFFDIQEVLGMLNGRVATKIEKITEENPRVNELAEFFQSSLRNSMFFEPEKEVQVQNIIEILLNGRGLRKGFEYDRESGKLEFSGKEYIPDFNLPGMELCIEVKLLKNASHKSKMVEEICADITAYKTKYRYILFIVYDLGALQNVEEFKSSINAQPGVKIVVVKH